ncbi:hypothetical protein Glove_216g126 [Diversispora epigaea]|uniref:Transposase putative helix-turn-helix domain-containing protein n=1 Tax=Diversispora epigaea TaxID=1348612 RepID=A0A397IGX5_9GLOM|nr:hypothetical protein Glove_216g126 [Diversispora epigaea]
MAKKANSLEIPLNLNQLIMSRISCDGSTIWRLRNAQNIWRINETKKICYARVSSEKSKEDLDRQCETQKRQLETKVLKDHTKEISMRLWLPEKTDSAAPNLVSLPRIYYQSLLSSQQDIMDLDQPRIIKDEKRLKTRKIRIYLTPEEKEKLKMWMGTVRWTYNKVLEMLQDDNINDLNIINKHYLVRFTPDSGT